MKKGIKEGSRIRIKKKAKKGKHVVYEGIMLPSASKNIVIKLDSGYNVGISPENAEIEVISGKKDYGMEKEKVEKKRERKRTEKAWKDLPNLSIISTGGTIASKVDYRTGAVTPQFSTEDILQAIPELEEVANIKGKEIYSILSENMRVEYWRKLAYEVYKEIQGGADGIIITHGTDTMGYTAAALSFMVQTPVPIVFVGSQRSADRPSSDSTMNAICAAKVACSDIAEVSVVMHGSSSDDFCYIHRGTRVRKMHTSARNAFQSINEVSIGKVYYERSIEKMKIETLNEYNKRGEKNLELEDHLEEKCCLLKFYPGANPKILNFYAENGYKGIVIEGTGLGHVSAEWVPIVEETVKKGIPVVITSQCIYGSINDRVYDTGRDLLRAGIIEGGDMLAETALVKLMWVLGKTKDMDEVRRLMERNIVGEKV